MFPKGTFHIQQQLPVNLLALQSSPRILRDDLGLEGFREVVEVVHGGATSHSHILTLAQEQAANGWYRPGRHSNHALHVSAVAEGKHEHVPSFLRVGPVGQLITPSGVMVRAAEPVRLFRGKQVRLGAIRPHELGLGLLVLWVEVARREGHDTRGTLQAIAAQVRGSGSHNCRVFLSLR